MYLDAGGEQEELQELQAEGSGEEEYGAPCEGHAGDVLLPGGSRCSVIVGATRRSEFRPLRMGHAPAEIELQKTPPRCPDRADPTCLLPARGAFVFFCPAFLLLRSVHTGAGQRFDRPGRRLGNINQQRAWPDRRTRPVQHINEQRFVYGQFTWRCGRAFTHGG